MECYSQADRANTSRLIYESFLGKKVHRTHILGREKYVYIYIFTCLSYVPCMPLYIACIYACKFYIYFQKSVQQTIWFMPTTSENKKPKPRINDSGNVGGLDVAALGLIMSLLCLVFGWYPRACRSKGSGYHHISPI